jgi:hypothetical protein
VYCIGPLNREQFVEVAVGFCYAMASGRLLGHQRLKIAHSNDSGCLEPLNSCNMLVGRLPASYQRNF